MEFCTGTDRITEERACSPVIRFIGLLAKAEGEDSPSAFLKILHIQQDLGR